MEYNLDTIGARISADIADGRGYVIAVVDSLDAGQTNSIMVYSDGTCGQLPIDQVADAKYRIDPSLLKLASPLAC